jgi:uncharacterized protein
MILYITSPTVNAGKTMFSAGLGAYWLNNGRKVGYLNILPAGAGEPAGIYRDAAFIKKILTLQEPVETLSSAIGPHGEGIRQAVEAVSGQKDIVIVEGSGLNAAAEIVEALAAKALIVHDYASPLSSGIAEYQKLGSRLMGVVINKVPSRNIERAREQVSKEAASSGIPVLGIIPEERILMALSVGDLAEALQGKILNSPEKSGDLIENIMMGSSTFDRGAAYYNRKNNKAVILWGDRPGFRKAAISNLQSAALQTSTRCLVISANSVPIAAVSQKALEKQVPVISAPGTLPSLITALEKAMEHLKFGQEKKLPQLEEVLGRSLNLKLISADLGLAI